jgi:cytidylate kinase
MKKITIAIDGYSSCGKSTLAKDLARTIGYTYIDSGAMYRAVTLYSLEHGFFEGDTLDLKKLREALPNIAISFQKNPETGQSETYVNGRSVEKEIRSMAVADKVSPIAAVGFVREEMVKQQQNLGHEKGIVMDGRDIGTVVFPDAELKFFITATLEVRAQRRLKELIDKGENATFKTVLHNLSKRDHIDSTRKDGPLKKAQDAIEIDNTNLTMAEQNRKVLACFEEIAKK